MTGERAAARPPPHRPVPEPGRRWPRRTTTSWRSPATRRPGATSASFRRRDRRSCSRCTRGRSSSRRCPSSRCRTCSAGCRCPCRPSSGIPMPSGILALQDLGDVTLQAHLGAARRRRARRRSTARPSSSSSGCSGAARSSPRRRALPYRLAFDVEKLTWELDFFVTHFVEGYRGAVLSPAERAALAGEWAAIAGELAAEPRVLCHRDYHSRNLMVHGGGLFIIDFQDARMGPDTYDLASLLRDSYVDIGDAELDELIAHFLALAGATGRRRVPPAVRPDGRPAQPQGARHVRQPGGRARKSRLHPVHAAHAARTRAPTSRSTRASPAFASCSRRTSPSCA